MKGFQIVRKVGGEVASVYIDTRGVEKFFWIGSVGAGTGRVAKVWRSEQAAQRVAAPLAAVGAVVEAVLS